MFTNCTLQDAKGAIRWEESVCVRDRTREGCFAGSDLLKVNFHRLGDQPSPAPKCRAPPLD